MFAQTLQQNKSNVALNIFCYVLNYLLLWGHVSQEMGWSIEEIVELSFFIV